MVGADQQVADYTNLRYTQVVMSDGVAKDLRNCKACHAGAKSDNWKQSPSRAACTSCHDNVDLKTGKNHLAGAQAEGTCIGCHLPEGPEFGPSIAGGAYLSRLVHPTSGNRFRHLKDRGHPTRPKPSRHLQLQTKGRSDHAAQMNNLRLVVAWPTTDYKIAVEEDARKAETQGNGVYMHTFKYKIPSEATGPGAIGCRVTKSRN